jgi:hypothetical protein
VIGFSPASLATSSTLTSSIVAGKNYIFRVRAQNIHLWGDWSPSKTIKAAQKPHQMATVTTSIDAAAGNLEIVWVAPADGSDTITGYLIEIQDGAGAWSTDTTTCDGSSSVIKAAKTCQVTMAALAALTNPLTFDALIPVRARA